MRIGVIGAGRIGGNVARQAVRAGHEAVVSYSRDGAGLAALADELGEHASVGSPAQAAACDLLVIAVPWGVLDDAIAQAGPLDGVTVVDTTNQFGPDGILDLGGVTAARHNAARMPGARYTKSFNTLTAAFQAQVAGRSGDERVVQWIAADDAEAAAAVDAFIASLGYAPVLVGGLDGCAVMEAPRRPGAVYGEEYRVPDAAAVVAAVRAGAPIPPTPAYA